MVRDIRNKCVWREVILKRVTWHNEWSCRPSSQSRSGKEQRFYWIFVIFVFIFVVFVVLFFASIAFILAWNVISFCCFYFLFL